jgi:hypothetical protein
MFRWSLFSMDYFGTWEFRYVGARSFGALDMIDAFLIHSSSSLVTVFNMGRKRMRQRLV